MATLAQRITDLATAIGTDVKALLTSQGSLSSLTTTDKTSLVNAVNEVKAAIPGAGVSINDTAGNGDTTVTWSADKIFDEIAAAKTAVTNALVNGAASTLDTLNELAAALGNDANFSTTIATALGKRVRYDAAQTLTSGEITQACANIGIGEPDTNFVTVYTAAKA
jgi:hypothetical protein